MNETKTACANCIFFCNGQCSYAEKCEGIISWSNELNRFVPSNYKHSENKKENEE